jgi:hypothetical protein
MASKAKQDDEDVAAMFPDSVAVNKALRTLARMSTKTARVKGAPKKRVG